MTMQDMATKLGYTYSTKKHLVETEGKTFYTRTDHILRDNKTGHDSIFRDRSSVTLFLESKAQLELLEDKTKGKGAR